MLGLCCGVLRVVVFSPQGRCSRRKTGVSSNKQDSGVAPTLTVGASAGKSERWTVPYMAKALSFPPTQEVLRHEAEDAIWGAMQKCVDAQAKCFYSTNPKRYAEMRKAYEILSELVCADEMTCKLSDMLKSIGEIEFICNDIDIQTDKMPLFLEAISLADNISMFAKGKRIYCGLSFNNVLNYERDHF